MNGLDFNMPKMPPTPVHIRGQMSMYVEIVDIYTWTFVKKIIIFGVVY